MPEESGGSAAGAKLTRQQPEGRRGSLGSLISRITTVANLKAAGGMTAKELKDGGFSAQELVKAGFPAWKLKEIGF